MVVLKRMLGFTGPHPTSFTDGETKAQRRQGAFLRYVPGEWQRVGTRSKVTEPSPGRPHGDGGVDRCWSAQGLATRLLNGAGWMNVVG